MSYCLNPDCPNPREHVSSEHPLDDIETAKDCRSCGSLLLLYDRYLALKPMTAEGLFGRTFLGVDRQRPSNPYCIIKQFAATNSSNVAPNKAVQRFHQEAIQLDQLGQHPQIPALLAYFEQDRYRYLVQEYVEGQTLDQELQETGPFSEAQIWRLLADLLPVLEFVHTRHVIHRDIRPTNIMRRFSNYRFVLLGFGASKIATLSALREVGTILETSIYTPPEQNIGRPLFASDLYSLGVSCLHLLAGKEPDCFFDLQTREWHWLDAMPQPPSEALQQVMNQLICGNLQERYQSAAVVLQDVLKSGCPVSDENQNEALPVPRPQTIPPKVAASNATLCDRWQCDRTLTGHQGWVRSLAISADSRWLVSGSNDQTVKIWQLETGELRQTFAGHTAWVNAVAISEDSRLIASASNDQTVKIWQLETGELQGQFVGHTGWVRAVASFPKTSSADWTLISGGQDTPIQLWCASQPTDYTTLTGHKNWVLSLAVSPDGHTFASGSNDCTIGLWDLDTSDAYHFLSGHTDKVLSVAINADGSILASGSADKTIKLWSLNTGSLLATLTGHTNAVNAVSFSPDDHTLASGSSDTTIKLWDLDNGQLLDTLTGHTDRVWSVAYSPNGRMLVSGSGDGTLKLWQSATSAELSFGLSDNPA